MWEYGIKYVTKENTFTNKNKNHQKCQCIVNNDKNDSNDIKKLQKNQKYDISQAIHLIPKCRYFQSQTIIEIDDTINDICDFTNHQKRRLSYHFFFFFCFFVSVGYIFGLLFC